MKRALSLTAAAAIAAGAAVTAVVGAAPASADVPTAAPGAYHQLAKPERAYDSRETTAGPLGKGATRAIDLSKQVTSASATAVVLNLTVANPTTGGFVTLYPGDQTSRPNASSINFRANEIRSNSVTVALPTAVNAIKAINAFNLNGTTQVIVDVLGWYDPQSINTDNGGSYLTESPFRALDTRTEGGPLAPGTGKDVEIPAKTVPEGVEGITAVAANITAVNPNGQGYLTAWAGGEAADKPATSTVNYGTDPVTPNFSVVPAFQDDSGAVDFRVDNSIARTDVLVDVVGYYVQGAGQGDLYVPVPPTRIADTREGTGAKPLGANSTLAVSAPDYNGAQALNVNVTAVDATNGTFLSVLPTPVAPEARPTFSNLNVFSPAGLANAAQTGVEAAEGSSDVSFGVYNLAGTVNVVADLEGYFVPFD